MDPVTFEPEVSSYKKNYNFRISSFEILETKDIFDRNLLENTSIIKHLYDCKSNETRYFDI